MENNQGCRRRTQRQYLAPAKCLTLLYFFPATSVRVGTAVAYALQSVITSVSNLSSMKPYDAYLQSRANMSHLHILCQKQDCKSHHAMVDLRHGCITFYSILRWLRCRIGLKPLRVAICR